MNFNLLFIGVKQITKKDYLKTSNPEVYVNLERMNYLENLEEVFLFMWVV
jgi:hypothetical protein